VPRNHPIHKFFQKIVFNRFFTPFIMAAIIGNCVVLAIDDPLHAVLPEDVFYVTVTPL
jgi:hypothetical protein